MVERHAAVVVEPTLGFDRFQILPHRRLLLESGRSVRIGSRAFDILLALLEKPGERIGKAELLARVWPGIHVVEGNLKFQVATLRRVLRDGQDGRRFIETSQGQGYCFVAPVAVVSGHGQPASPAVAGRRHNLPEQLTTLVGRDELLPRLVEQLARHRLLTIVGAGGIGKTAVALAVAERVIDDFEDGVWLVDFARIADPGLVRGAVAGAVGLDVGPGLTMRELVAALRSRRMLLVLDNCMHVVDAVAALVAAILRDAPQIRILATSREALRTEGEHLCRLGPLEVPPPSRRIGAAEAQRYAAVQLFVEQATASLDGFELDDAHAPVVAEICRKLDGIPLAIELAAARIGVLGLDGVEAQLDDRLKLLTGGRRTDLPRHRTMRAALDWSYDLLDPAEQATFRRLAIFVGGFTLAAAVDVLADESHSAEEVERRVLDLATKSLVVADLDTPGPRFRLLETTRAYAAAMARESGELAPLARRHAAHLLELVEARSRDASVEDGYAALEHETGNLRAALSWAFGRAGDPTIGVGLTAAALPLWVSISLMGEAHGWIEKAIAALAEAGLEGSRQEMVLQAGSGITLQLVGAGTAGAHAALQRALALAEQFGDTDCQLRVLQTLWVYHMRVGEVRMALDAARRTAELAASVTDPDATTTAAWMLGIALQWAGDHRAARDHLGDALRGAQRGSRRRRLLRAGFDPHITARYVLGHGLWITGHPEQAAEAVRLAVEDARRLQHPVTLCSALAWGACALSLRAGDLDAAWQSVVELNDLAERHAFADHLAYGRAAQAVIALRKAGPHAGIAQVQAALECWRASQWHVVLGVVDFAEAAARAGLVREIAAIVDDALERSERNQALWAYPETLRVKGELLLRQDAPDPAAARRFFALALERARGQGALAWQLRAAASLHRLDLGAGDANASRALLSDVCRQFDEGLETADLQAARQLLIGRPPQG